MPTSEVTPVPIQDIRPPHRGHTSQYPGHERRHPFRSMSIGCPFPEIRLFQPLTLKLQGQGHNCGQRQGHRVCPVSY